MTKVFCLLYLLAASTALAQHVTIERNQSLMHQASDMVLLNEPTAQASPPFTWIVEKERVEVGPDTMVRDNEILGSFTNTTGKPINLTFRRYNERVPETWTTSVCLGALCHSAYSDTSEEVLTEVPAYSSIDFVLHMVDEPGLFDSIIVGLRIRAITGNDADTLYKRFVKVVQPMQSVSRFSTQNEFGIESLAPSIVTGASITLRALLGEDPDASVHIYDMLGNEVAPATLFSGQPKSRTTLTMVLPHLPAGQYFVRLESDVVLSQAKSFRVVR